MKKDLAKNIKYILENFDNLDLNPIDLTELKMTLSFIKTRVQQEIIARELEGNEEVRDELEFALESLRKRKDELEQEKSEKEESLEFKYPEYEPIEKDDEVSTALQEQVNKKRKKEYQKDKDKAEEEHNNLIPEIERQIKIISERIHTLEELESEIEKPEEFISKFLEKEYADLDERKQEIINICANSMKNYSGSPERFKGNLLFNYSDKGYIINPEVVKEFLEVARDEELAKEINTFGKAKRETNKAEKETEKSQKRYDLVSERKKDFEENPELVNGIAQNIEGMTELVASIRINNTNMPVAYNPLSKFFNNILGNRRIKKANSSYKKFEEKFEENSNKIKENPEYSNIYDTFTHTAKVKVLGNNYVGNPYRDDSRRNPYADPYEDSRSDPYSSNSNIDTVDSVTETLCKFGMDRIEAIQFSRLYMWTKGKKAQELISEVSEQLDSLETSVGAELKENRDNYEQKKENEEKVFETLSPKGQEKVKSSTNFSSEVSIGKYIDITYSVSKGEISPYIASIMLQALVETADIRTVEDAKKMGLFVTEEEVETAIQNARKYVPNITKYTKTVEEKIDETRNDDESR